MAVPTVQKRCCLERRTGRTNPCAGLEHYKEQARERYLSPAEIPAVGEAIRSCEASNAISPWHAGLFRCLLLTGMRRDELRTLEWRCVDLNRLVFILEDSKVGRRDVPIAAPVLQVLAALPRIEGNPFAGIAHARPHDLRHTAASVGAAAGSSLLLIGGVLGHRNSKTTERYAHLADDPVRATAETISERIAKALDGQTADIVPFALTKRQG